MEIKRCVPKTLLSSCYFLYFIFIVNMSSLPKLLDLHTQDLWKKPSSATESNSVKRNSRRIILDIKRDILIRFEAVNDISYISKRLNGTTNLGKWYVALEMKLNRMLEKCAVLTVRILFFKIDLMWNLKGNDSLMYGSRIRFTSM